MMKYLRLCVATAAVLLMMLLVACGGGSKPVSMYDLNKAMSGAVSFSDMKYVSSQDAEPDDLFSNVSDMDYGKVQGFFIFYAAKGAGNADELVAVQVKKSADLPEAVASLKAHLEKRRTLYATYDKTQVKKLEEGRVLSEGDVAALIVADEPEKIEKAFHNFFRDKK